MTKFLIALSIALSSSVASAFLTPRERAEYRKEMQEELKLFSQSLREERNSSPKKHQSWQPVVGQQYYLYGTMSSSYLVTIIEPRERGEYAFRWDNGPFVGKYALNARPANLAQLQGCTSEGICVGHRVIVPARQSMLAEIVGVSHTGEVVLCALSGPYYGQCGGSWRAKDLLRAQ